jgi:hypothetical protein
LFRGNLISGTVGKLMRADWESASTGAVGVTIGEDHHQQIAIPVLEQVLTITKSVCVNAQTLFRLGRGEWI